MSDTGSGEVIKPVAVYPKFDCPHVHVKDYTGLPAIQVYEIYRQCNECFSCKDKKENWICLGCGVVGCSRYVASHMAEHNRNSNHGIVLSFSDLSVWCYLCEDYIVSDELTNHLASARFAKFGMQGESFFACNGCKKRFTATEVRWHCTICSDFDICSGCKTDNNYGKSASHSADHTYESSLG